MKEVKYKGNYLEVSEEILDGHTYERVLLKSGVRVYPVKENKILIINEQKRHEGISRWKFIGGWLDKDGKDELVTAKEELLEEVGMKSDEWEQFHVFDTGNATVGIKSTYFIVKNPKVVDNPPQNPDLDIINEFKWVDLAELWQMIDDKKLLWDFDALAGIQVLRRPDKIK